MRIVFRPHDQAVDAKRPKDHLADVALLLDEEPFPGPLTSGVPEQQEAAE